MDRESQRRKLITKFLVGGRTVVLDQVTGDRHDIGGPIGRLNVVQDSLQRIVRYGATQTLVRISEQMRIRNLQYPNWIC